MENKSNVLASIVGGIVILIIFIGVSFFIGQKIKEKFYKPPVTKTTVINEPITSLLTEEKTTADKTTIPVKYTVIPQTGPESLGLILLPLIGVTGIYFKSKFAS